MESGKVLYQLDVSTQVTQQRIDKQKLIQNKCFVNGHQRKILKVEESIITIFELKKPYGTR